MTNTSQKLKTRVTLKYNHILMENKDIWVSGHGVNNVYSMKYVQELLNDGNFENFIQVQLSSESGSFGPDMKPSPLRIKKLLRLLKNTNYKIVQQNGQTFTLEGLN